MRLADISHLMYLDIRGSSIFMMTLSTFHDNNSYIIVTYIFTVFRNLVLNTVSRTKFPNTVFRNTFLDIANMQINSLEKSMVSF